MINRFDLSKCRARVLMPLVVVAIFLNGFGQLANATSDKIVCNVFDLTAELSGDELSFSLETDLPSFATLMVSVSRSYEEAGDSSEYAIDYFQERISVDRVRDGLEVDVSDSRWLRLLDEKKRSLARAGMPFEVGRIYNEIEIRVVMPVNQSDPRFGKRNENLTGRAVSTSGLRIIRAEKAIDAPLASDSATQNQASYGDPQTLNVGWTYKLSARTPIAPAADPENPLAAIKKIRHVPKGTRITIDGTRLVNVRRWYLATVIEENGRESRGWINSVALGRQNLLVTDRGN